jgi:putative oxidoreductase
MFSRDKLATWSPVPLRLIVGLGFIEHGYAKLLKGPEAFASILHALHVPAPHWMAWLTILTELVGGLAVSLGAFVPFVSVPMAGVLFVAMVTVHVQHGFSSIKLLAVTSAGAKFGPPGYECDLLYVSCLLALLRGRVHFHWMEHSFDGSTGNKLQRRCTYPSRRPCMECGRSCRKKCCQ